MQFDIYFIQIHYIDPLEMSCIPKLLGANQQLLYKDHQLPPKVYHGKALHASEMLKYEYLANIDEREQKNAVHLEKSTCIRESIRQLVCATKYCFPIFNIFTSTQVNTGISVENRETQSSVDVSRVDLEKSTCIWESIRQLVCATNYCSLYSIYLPQLKLIREKSVDWCFVYSISQQLTQW